MTDINSQEENLHGNQISPKSEDLCIFGDHFGFKLAAIANQRWKSIRNIIIYLETKFRSNRRIFVLCTIANQNGRHMVQHILLPVNIHFH
jgi:hypothetical protein